LDGSGDNARMKYISTRGRIEPIAFQQAVLMGLADDGGLIIPERIPSVADRRDELAGLSYTDLAREIFALFATDLPAEDLRELVDRTYGPNYGGPVAPVRAVGPMYVLELFHGPTLAFKDVALQFLGNLFEYILARTGGRLNILGATSGDPGSAAIHGCRGRTGIDIFIMHPAGRVSPIQQKQMTTVLDDNVHNIAVDGSFDDCQRIMKTLAADLDFKRAYSLGAVNSVNWARVLAQIVYYFSAAFEVQRRAGVSAVRFAVPTGNFGDILAGWYAMQMGAPISQLILATNDNDILARFFTTGEYSCGDVHRTLAPAMDIQVASNFERYLYHRLGEDTERLRETMEDFADRGTLRVEPDLDGAVDPTVVSAAATTDDVLAAIRHVWTDHEYVLDPHTACGWSVAERVAAAVPAGGGADDGEDPILCVATAHPAKFPDAIARATGRDDLATHPKIEALMDQPERCASLPGDIEAVRAFIRRTLEQPDRA
jgi:threonine synthase